MRARRLRLEREELRVREEALRGFDDDDGEGMLGLGPKLPVAQVRRPNLRSAMARRAAASAESGEAREPTAGAEAARLSTEVAADWDIDRDPIPASVVAQIARMAECSFEGDLQQCGSSKP